MVAIIILSVLISTCFRTSPGVSVAFMTTFLLGISGVMLQVFGYCLLLGCPIYLVITSRNNP